MLIYLRVHGESVLAFRLTIVIILGNGRILLIADFNQLSSFYTVRIC